MATRWRSPPESVSGRRASNAGCRADPPRRRTGSSRRRPPHAEAQIGLDRHVRKQLGVLEHQPNPPPLRRQPHPGLRIDQHLPVDADKALIRTEQPAAALMMVDLPAPDGPNSTVTPAEGTSKAMSMSMVGNRWRSRNNRLIGRAPRSAACRAIPTAATRSAPGSATPSTVAPPWPRRPALAARRKSPAAAFASAPGCWRRR